MIIALAFLDVGVHAQGVLASVSVGSSLSMFICSRMVARWGVFFGFCADAFFGVIHVLRGTVRFQSAKKGLPTRPT